MKKKRFFSTVKNMVKLYLGVNIPMVSAAFCYFVTLSIFPMLICLHAMLGNLFPSLKEVESFLTGLLPAETISSLLEYVDYVSKNHSTTMVVVAVTAMATTSAAAFRTIDVAMGQMRGRSRFEGFFAVVFSFIFSILFLVAMYASAILIVTGKWFVDFIDKYIMFVNIAGSWSWVRFFLLFALLFVMIIGVYRFTAPKGARVRILPGAALASFALVAVSILFSYFIGASIRYHLLYGSLASIMILMLWIYTCGMIVFVGNTLNVSLEILDGESE